MQLEVLTPQAMFSLGATLGNQFQAGDLVILTGPLGAGKTMLTRGIGEGMHVRGPITSPTFIVARTHPPLGNGAPLVHVDAYRLASAAEVDDLDIDFASSVVVAEWGIDKFVNTHESWLEIDIARPSASDVDTDEGSDVDPDDAPIEPRHIEIRTFGPRWAKGLAL